MHLWQLVNGEVVRILVEEGAEYGVKSCLP